MQSAAMLRESTHRQDISGVDGAIQQCFKEIERRGRLLLVDVNNLDPKDTRKLMVYASLANNIGYAEMRRTGNEILNERAQFPQLTVRSIIKYGGRFLINAIEDRTNMEFLIPCKSPLKQYIGGPIENLDALQAYVGKEVTLDVLRKGAGYEGVMIGRSKDVLGDAPRLDARLNILR